jgi:hypothetical protein
MTFLYSITCSEFNSWIAVDATDHVVATDMKLVWMMGYSLRDVEFVCGRRGYVCQSRND